MRLETLSCSKYGAKVKELTVSTQVLRGREILDPSSSQTSPSKILERFRLHRAEADFLLPKSPFGFSFKRELRPILTRLSSLETILIADFQDTTASKETDVYIGDPMGTRELMRLSGLDIMDPTCTTIGTRTIRAYREHWLARRVVLVDVLGVVSRLQTFKDHRRHVDVAWEAAPYISEASILRTIPCNWSWLMGLNLIRRLSILRREDRSEGHFERGPFTTLVNPYNVSYILDKNSLYQDRQCCNYVLRETSNLQHLRMYQGGILKIRIASMIRNSPGLRNIEFTDVTAYNRSLLDHVHPWLDIWVAMRAHSSLQSSIFSNISVGRGYTLIMPDIPGSLPEMFRCSSSWTSRGELDAALDVLVATARDYVLGIGDYIEYVSLAIEILPLKC